MKVEAVNVLKIQNYLIWKRVNKTLTINKDSNV